jgi:hypothetical protein
MKRRFNAYARAATGPVGIDPMLVRIDFDD